MKISKLLFGIATIILFSCEDNVDDPPPSPNRNYIFYTYDYWTGKTKPGIKLTITNAGNYMAMKQWGATLSTVSTDTGYVIFKSNDIKNAMNGLQSGTLYLFIDDTTSNFSNLESFGSFQFDDRSPGSGSAFLQPSLFQALSSTDWDLKSGTINGTPGATLIPCITDDFVSFGMSIINGGRVKATFDNNGTICPANDWGGDTTYSNTNPESIFGSTLSDSLPNLIVGSIQNFSTISLDSSTLSNIVMEINTEDSLLMHSDVFDATTNQAYTITYKFGRK